MIYEIQMPKTPWKVELPKNIKKFMHEQTLHPIVYNRFERKAFCFKCGEYFNYTFTGNIEEIAETGSRIVYGMDKFTSGDNVQCPLCGHKGTATTHTYGLIVDTATAVARYANDTIYITMISSVYYTPKTKEEFCNLKNKVADIYVDEICKINRKEQISMLQWGQGTWQATGKVNVHYEITRNYPTLHPSFVNTIKKSFLKFALKNDIYKDNINITVKRIALHAKYPQLEYLNKAGLTAIESSLLYGTPIYLRPNWRKKDLSGVLGITNQDLDKLKQWEMDDIEGIAIYKIIKKTYKNPSKKQVELVQQLMMAKNTFTFFNKRDIYRSAKYIKKQYDENKPCCAHGASGYSVDRIIGTYKDYLEIMDKLNYEKSDYYIYPKNLSDAHDRVAEEHRNKIKKMKIEEMKEKDKKYKKFLEQLEKLTYCDGEYLVRPLRDYEEFLCEGKENRNCVASYYESAVKGANKVFTVRRARDPDATFLTVEVENDFSKIKQCYGKGNSAPPIEARAFVDKWLEEIVKTSHKAA